MISLQLAGCKAERVRNGGFEKTYSSDFEGMMPKMWFSSLSPDLFSKRNVKDLNRSVPVNFAGAQECVDDGDNYLGLAMYLQDQVNAKGGVNNKVYCEFVWCRLKKLRSNTITLSFDYSLSDSSCFCSDFLYIAFSKNPPKESENGFVFNKSSIKKLKITNFIESKDKWITYSAEVKVSKNAKYFAIGNFSNLYSNSNYDDQFVSIQNSPCSQVEKSMYLYLDNISIQD